ncbi:selenide, water dikinase, partial [mine drainage metagenome]
GVYLLDDDTALVQSVDYFTPVLDDPYDYGQAAAANALSDIYAMGARPLTALNLLGYPPGELPAEVVSRIIQGGADKVRESGAVVLGGHTVDDNEPKFGYAVVGVARPDRLLTKSGATAGDLLVLTKPIGVGVLTSAIKKVDVPTSLVREVTEVMVHLNRVGQDLAPLGVRAATDITGFGLLGHAGEMARASGLGLRIQSPGRVARDSPLRWE